MCDSHRQRRVAVAAGALQTVSSSTGAASRLGAGGPYADAGALRSANLATARRMISPSEPGPSRRTAERI